MMIVTLCLLLLLFHEGTSITRPEVELISPLRGYSRLLDMNENGDVAFILTSNEGLEIMYRYSKSTSSLAGSEVANVQRLIVNRKQIYLCMQNDTFPRDYVFATTSIDNLEFKSEDSYLMDLTGLGVAKDGQGRRYLGLLDKEFVLMQVYDGKEDYFKVRGLSSTLHVVQSVSKGDVYIVHGRTRMASVLFDSDLKAKPNSLKNLNARKINRVEHVNHLVVDHKDRVIFATDSGVSIVTDGENRTDYLKNETFLMCAARDEDIAFCATKHKAFQINYYDGSVQELYRFDNRSNPQYKDRYFLFIAITKDNYQYYATDESAVYGGEKAHPIVVRMEFPRLEKIRNMVAYKQLFVLAENLYIYRDQDNFPRIEALPPGEKYMVHQGDTGYIGAYNGFFIISNINVSEYDGDRRRNYYKFHPPATSL